MVIQKTEQDIRSAVIYLLIATTRADRGVVVVVTVVTIAFPRRSCALLVLRCTLGVDGGRVGRGGGGVVVSCLRYPINDRCQSYYSSVL